MSNIIRRIDESPSLALQLHQEFARSVNFGLRKEAVSPELVERLRAKAPSGTAMRKFLADTSPADSDYVFGSGRRVSVRGL